MPDRTQEIKNLKAVAQACKNYTDNKIKKVYYDIGHNDITTDDHTNELAYQITAPANAKLLMLQSIGGNTVKLSPSVASDSTKAMIKTMPSTVYTFDGSKFYGDSEVSENLIVLTDTAQTTDRGITYSISNGTINVGDSANANLTITLSSLTYFNGTYTFKNFGSQALSNNAYFVFLLNGEWTTVVTIKSDSGTITLNGNYVYGIAITSGTSVSGTIKPMLVEGSTAPTEFKVGYTDIHNLELSGLKVEGYNKVNVENKTETIKNGITYSSTNGAIKLKGTATAGFNISWASRVELKKGSYRMALFFSGSYTGIIGNYLKTTGGVIVLDGNTLTNPSTSLTLTEDKDNIFFDLYIGSNAVISQEITITPMLVLGTDMPTSFVPYIAPTTKTIDLTTIVDSNNNKLFPNGKLMGNENVKDVLGVYNQESKWDEVDLGDLNYVYDANRKYFYSAAFGSLVKIPANNTTLANAISGLYDTVIQDNIFHNVDRNLGLDMVLGVQSGNGLLMIVNLNFTDATAFKTAMSGVKLQYERNTYLTSNTDLSATLRNIQGYPNGSIIAENTHNMEVESVITYNSIIQETLCPSVTVDGANKLGSHNLALFGNNRYILTTQNVLILPNTTYTFSNSISSGADGSISILDESLNVIQTIVQSSANKQLATFTTLSNAKYFKIDRWYIDTTSFTIESAEVMLNEGSTALSYRPYKASITRNLPTQASDGWSAGTQRNYRVFCDDEGNEVSKRETNVNKNNSLGSLNGWIYDEGQQRFAIVDVFGDAKFPNENTIVSNIIIPNDYTAVSYKSIYTAPYTDLRIAGAIINNHNYFSIRDLRYNDATTFANAMSGVPLYYELADASKTETDMDDFDFFFDVEEGDVITFNNPYAQQVYATYSFLIKEAKSNE